LRGTHEATSPCTDDNCVVIFQGDVVIGLQDDREKVILL